jgi:2-keto-3-deoxy-L-rhamnonate aldolase RhmA
MRVQELEAIAAVEDIDGIVTGPGDLSSYMGHVGAPHPEVLKVITQTIQRIRSTGKAARILFSVDSEIRRWLDLGAFVCSCGR